MSFVVSAGAKAVPPLEAAGGWAEDATIPSASASCADVLLHKAGCPVMAHSRTIGARTTDPERTFELRPLKVRMGWGAAVRY